MKALTILLASLLSGCAVLDRGTVQAYRQENNVNLWQDQDRQYYYTTGNGALSGYARDRIDRAATPDGD